MAMGNDDVFHFRGIETQFLHAADQHILGIVDMGGIVEDVAVV